jgi:addiction module HigA family antidote
MLPPLTKPQASSFEAVLRGIPVLSTLPAHRAGFFDVDRTTLNEVVNARRGVTPDMALRLARAFGPSPQYWLNLQTAVDLYDAQHSPKAARIAKIRPLVTA